VDVAAGEDQVGGACMVCHGPRMTARRGAGLPGPAHGTAINRSNPAPILGT
jgi:mono/diheme cytochrome c family protein